MKQKTKHFAYSRVLVIGIGIFFLAACQKDLKTSNPNGEVQLNADSRGHLVQTKTYTSEVAVKWEYADAINENR